MTAGACAHFVTRIRKTLFSTHFDLGWDVTTIHRQLMKCYSRRQVQRLVKELKKLHVGGTETQQKWPEEEALPVGSQHAIRND